ncbi:MAG: hypothetical protein OEV35_06240 [Gallionellaceae bacterium]|nr:hypothetical protein [Gallionellaceae bacterium]
MVDLITQISAIIALWSAIYGIDSWRREHIGRKKADTAEEALALVYEAADAIEYIRHPISFGSEHGEIERGESESVEQWQARRNANVAFVRYNKHQELFNKLHAMRYRFMAQFGKEKVEPLNEVRRVVNEVLTAANALSRLWPRAHFRTDDQWEKHQQQIEKYEAKFWSMMSEEDELANRVRAAVSAMEATARAEIEGRSTLHSVINKRLHK